MTPLAQIWFLSGHKQDARFPCLAQGPAGDWDRRTDGQTDVLTGRTLWGYPFDLPLIFLSPQGKYLNPTMTE